MDVESSISKITRIKKREEEHLEEIMSELHQLKEVDDVNKKASKRYIEESEIFQTDVGTILSEVRNVKALGESVKQLKEFSTEFSNMCSGLTTAVSDGLRSLEGFSKAVHTMKETLASPSQPSQHSQQTDCSLNSAEAKLQTLLSEYQNTLNNLKSRRIQQRIEQQSSLHNLRQITIIPG